MDFNKLMQQMRDLDQPVGESTVQECGPMGDMAPPMGGMTNQPPPSHPSLSINLNAQGMDNIEEIMKLMTKVNPDMINQPMHSPKPMPMPMPMPSLGNLDAGPLKMLPDFDGDNDNMPGGEKDSMDLPKDHDKDHIMIKSLDKDGDSDHDMDDHDLEKKDSGDEDKDDKEKDEAWENEPDAEVKSVDYMNNQLAGGMNRPKGTYPKVAGADNPMQKTEGMDLRSQIRAELQQRLAEAKGAK